MISCRSTVTCGEKEFFQYCEWTSRRGPRKRLEDLMKMLKIILRDGELN